jgi:hypothetical protein
MNFLAKFSKIRQIFAYNLFSFESQTESVGNFNRFSHFVTPLQMRCTSTEDTGNIWSPYRQWSRFTLLYVRSVQLYTRPLAAIILEFEKSHFKYHAGNQSFWFSLQHFLVTFLITSLHPPSWHFQFITSYTTHSDLIGTVWINWIQISFWCVSECNSEIIHSSIQHYRWWLTVLPESEQFLFHALFLISVPLQK